VWRTKGLVGDVRGELSGKRAGDVHSTVVRNDQVASRRGTTHCDGDGRSYRGAGDV
jgi:hypothetical protein